MSMPDGRSPIRLINTETQSEKTIATADLPAINDFEFMVDAHPAWDRSGRFVTFNGTYNGTRSVFIADLIDVLKR
jgi:hypothetical protein